MVEASKISGTAAYMAPEMFVKSTKTNFTATSSRATDMYAFGTLCWEVLTGREPWPGETVSSRGIDAGVAAKTGVAYSMLDLKLLPKDIPEPVRALISRCLDGNREKRPFITEVMKAFNLHAGQMLGGLFDVFLSHKWNGNFHHPLTDFVSSASAFPFPFYSRLITCQFSLQVYQKLLAEGLRVWRCVCKPLFNLPFCVSAVFHLFLQYALSLTQSHDRSDKEHMDHDKKSSMTEGIENSQCVVALVSRSYAYSPDCIFELEKAKALGKPVILCDVNPPLSLQPSGISDAPRDCDCGSCPNKTWALYSCKKIADQLPGGFSYHRDFLFIELPADIEVWKNVNSEGSPITVCANSKSPCCNKCSGAAAAAVVSKLCVIL